MQDSHLGDEKEVTFLIESIQETPFLTKMKFGV